MTSGVTSLVIGRYFSNSVSYGGWLFFLIYLQDEITGMNVGIAVLIVVLFILLNGIFVLSETAVVSSRKVRLQQRANEGDAGAYAALQLSENPNTFIFIISCMSGCGKTTAAGPRNAWRPGTCCTNILTTTR